MKPCSVLFVKDGHIVGRQFRSKNLAVKKMPEIKKWRFNEDEDLTYYVSPEADGEAKRINSKPFDQ